jgi:hypothetical protein
MKPNTSLVRFSSARARIGICAALLAVGCAGKGMRAVAPAPKPERVVWVEGWDALGEIRGLKLEWVGASGGKESLDLDVKSAVLFRGGGTQTLALGEGEFSALAGKVAALGRFAEYPDRRERLAAYFVVRGAGGEKRFKIDIHGPIRPLYAELKALRDKVLEHGR